MESPDGWKSYEQEYLSCCNVLMTKHISVKRHYLNPKYDLGQYWMTILCKKGKHKLRISP
jgi:hypothetical protein